MGSSDFRDLKVDKLGQFAKATHVSQEVGTEGYGLFPHCAFLGCSMGLQLRDLTIDPHTHKKLADKPWCLMSRVHGMILLMSSTTLPRILHPRSGLSQRLPGLLQCRDLSRQIKVNCSGKTPDLKSTVNGMVIWLRVRLSLFLFSFSTIMMPLD